jgi:hypothetical protein
LINFLGRKFFGYVGIMIKIFGRDFFRGRGI